MNIQYNCDRQFVLFSVINLDERIQLLVIAYYKLFYKISKAKPSNAPNPKSNNTKTANENTSASSGTKKKTKFEFVLRI